MNTDRITHQQAREWLDLDRDGALRDDQRCQLYQHLQECSECSRFAEQTALLDSILHSSLQARWPSSQPDSAEINARIMDIHGKLAKSQSRTNHRRTIWSFGWGALAILLIAGLAWTIKNLAPLPGRAPVKLITAEVIQIVVEPTMRFTPMPVESPQGSERIISGEWIAQTDFGTLVFTVDAQGMMIIRTDFRFKDWSCGKTVHSGDIVDATSWSVENNAFTITSTFDNDAQVHMHVNGSYDQVSQVLSGTWEEVSYDITCSGEWQATHQPEVAYIPPTGSASLFPGVNFSFTSELPSAPDKLTLYQQQLSEAVTAESARQVATQWGVAGGVYSSPSEGMNDVIFDVMDGARSMRFLNFPDQFIYTVGNVSPEYGSAWMDHGLLPSYDEQVSIATSFLEPFGILDMPYTTLPFETERGIVAFIPLLDGYPVYQEIGVDRSNIGWIDVKVNTPGQVTMVQYSRHTFQPTTVYPILTAQQAWERFTNDANLQHSRYAVLSPEVETTYQSWSPRFMPGQQADIYGWVNTHFPVDTSSPAMVMINDLPIIGDTAGISPENKYDIRFVHAWGELQGSSTDGVALRVSGWEISSLQEEYITGTLMTQSGELQLVSLDHTLTVLNPPSDLPDGLQVGIQGVVLDGEPASLNWKFIETGEIPFSYGASSSCGGSGGGGGGSSTSNFGSGSFAPLRLQGEENSPVTETASPYQPGDGIIDVSGIVYVTRHLYPGGNTSLEVIFIPDPSSGLDASWAYSLVGDALAGIDQLNNLSIILSGQVDRVENQVIYINVSRYEPRYPGEQIQAFSGSEQIVTLDGQEVVLFTTSYGDAYVLNSSIVFKPADANIIGRLGDLIEIEGYLMPDQQVGGYLVLKDTAGSVQVDGVAESGLVNVWDHSQDPSSDLGAVLQGTVTIDTVELAYDAINLDRCQASSAADPNIASQLVVQPMWVFSGQFEDGRRFIVQVQALPDQFLK